METTTKRSKDEQSYYSYHVNCIRNNYLLSRLFHHATTAFQEMQWITQCQSTTVTASYEEMKLNITSHDRIIKMPNLTQQSLWEGGPSLHTEMLDEHRLKTLRSEVNLCIKKAGRLHNSREQLIQWTGYGFNPCLRPVLHIYTT